MAEKEKACGLHCTKINNISVTIGKQQILKNVSIHIHCGELTVIIGRNGAGKSTLLKAILGEIKHTGTITFVDMKENRTKNIRIGYVPQSINIEKDMPTTVYDFCASFMSSKPVWIKKDKGLYEKIKTSLKKFNADKLIDKGIGNLSGGELQRVLLTVATTPLPNLLILDEPVSGIDRNGIKAFYELVNKLKTENDISIILVSHDLDLVYKYSDRVALVNGTIVCSGTPKQVFNNPAAKKIFGLSFGSSNEESSNTGGI